MRNVVISSEVKAIKPNPRIYQILFEGCGVDPRPAIFIDDIAVNIEAPRRLGLY
jgi:2-haloacid dehalogenase